MSKWLAVLAVELLFAAGMVMAMLVGRAAIGATILLGFLLAAFVGARWRF